MMAMTANQRLWKEIYVIVLAHFLIIWFFEMVSNNLKKKEVKEET